MANPARKPPIGTEHPESAVDILRRLEPVLAKLDERTQRIETEQRRQADVQRKQGEDIAEIKGQLKFMPTIWTIAALTFTIFGASFALIRYAMGH